MDRISQIRLLLQSEPEDIFLHYALAMEHLSAGDKTAAIQELEFIKSLRSDYLPLYYQLAQLYAESEENDKAVALYEKGMELARIQGDEKTRRELGSALEELIF